MTNELLLSLAFLVAFGLGGALLGRIRGEATPWWPGAWASLMAAGVAVQMGMALPVGTTELPLSFVFSSAFCFLAFAGALESTGRTAPRWIPLLALGFGTLRAALVASGRLPLAGALSLAIDVPLLVAAAVLTWLGTRDDESWVRRLLPLGVGLLVLPRLLDSLEDLRGPDAHPFPVWALVAAPVAALQVVAALVAARRESERATEALEANLRRFGTLAESAHDLITETDAEGRIVYASPNIEDVLGYAPAELVGRSCFDLLHPDGSPGPDDLRSTSSEADGLRFGPLRVRHRDGSWRWIEGTLRSYRDAAGERRILLTQRDVGERLAMEERLRQSQKLESLGLLTGGIAHDFNNLLVPILGNAGLLREQVSDRPELDALARDIEEGAQRAADLTRQLLTSSGQGPTLSEPLDLARLVRDVAQLLEHTLPRKVRLSCKHEQDLPPVRGDPSQLHQAILNLVTNGVESLPDAGGSVELTIRRLDLDADVLGGCLGTDEPPPGRYVCLEVRDDGCGMDEATRARIFDPFFTTKRDGRGLGLAFLLGTLRSHGGGVLVESGGTGTTFRLVFPCAEAPVAAEEATAPTGRPPAAHGTVMVVDDEEGVRRMAARALDRAGFDVVEAENGLEALSRLRRQPHVFRAILLDLSMPQLPGEETFAHVRRLAPDLPVVLSSGFSRPEVRERLPRDDRVAFLQKPYSPGTLVDTVAGLVAGDA